MLNQKGPKPETSEFDDMRAIIRYANKKFGIEPFNYTDFWVEPKEGWEKNQEIKNFKNFEDISLGYQYVHFLAQNIPGFPFQDTPAWHPNQVKLLTPKVKKKLTDVLTYARLPSPIKPKKSRENMKL